MFRPFQRCIQISSGSAGISGMPVECGARARTLLFFFFSFFFLIDYASSMVRKTPISSFKSAFWLYTSKKIHRRFQVDTRIYLSRTRPKREKCSYVANNCLISYTTYNKFFIFFFKSYKTISFIRNKYFKSKQSPVQSVLANLVQ